MGLRMKTFDAIFFAAAACALCAAYGQAYGGGEKVLEMETFTSMDFSELERRGRPWLLGASGLREARPPRDVVSLLLRNPSDRELFNRSNATILACFGGGEKEAKLETVFVPPNSPLEAPARPGEIVCILNSVDGMRYEPLRWSGEAGAWIPLDFYELEKMAASGSSAAQVVLGGYYLRGERVAGDFKKAYECFASAAQAGNPAGRLALGQMFRDGVGVEADRERGAEYVREAAEAGYAPAFSYMGYALMKGLGCAENRAAARAWLEKGAAAGDDMAFMLLSELAAAEPGGRSASANFLAEARRRGNRHAAELLGDMLYAEAVRVRAGGKPRIRLDAVRNDGEPGWMPLLNMAGEQYSYAAERGMPGAMVKFSYFGYVRASDRAFLQNRAAEILMEGAGDKPARAFYALALLHSRFDRSKYLACMSRAWEESKPGDAGFDRAKAGMCAAEWKARMGDAAGAFEILEDVYSEYGRPEALFEMAAMRLDKSGPVYDPAEALSLCFQAEEAGAVQPALSALARAHTGDFSGVEVVFAAPPSATESERARALFRMADFADFSINPRGAYDPSSFSENPRPEQIVKWYGEAAALGNPDAMSRYGEYLEFEKKDGPGAFEMYAKAFGADPLCEGAVNLARALGEGAICPPDVARAREIMDSLRHAQKPSSARARMEKGFDVTASLYSARHSDIPDEVRALLPLLHSGNAQDAEGYGKLLDAAVRFVKSGGASRLAGEDALAIFEAAGDRAAGEGDEASAADFYTAPGGFSSLPAASRLRAKAAALYINGRGKLEDADFAAKLLDGADSSLSVAAHVRAGDFAGAFAIIERLCPRSASAPSSDLQRIKYVRDFILKRNGPPSEYEVAEKILAECARSGADGALEDLAEVRMYLGDFDGYFRAAKAGFDAGRPGCAQLYGRALEFGIGTAADADAALEAYLKSLELFGAEMASAQDGGENPAADGENARRLGEARMRAAHILMARGDFAGAEKAIGAREGFLKAAVKYFWERGEYAESSPWLEKWKSEFPDSVEPAARQAEMASLGLGRAKDFGEAMSLYLSAMNTARKNFSSATDGARGWRSEISDVKILNGGMISLLLENGKTSEAAALMSGSEEAAKFEGALYRGYFSGKFDESALAAHAHLPGVKRMLGLRCLKAEKDFAAARAWFESAGIAYEMSKLNPEKITAEDARKAAEMLSKLPTGGK